MPPSTSSGPSVKLPEIMEDKIQEETPYHENTKVRKQERRGGYLEQQVVFRAFQLSCFRDGFCEDLFTTDHRQRTTDT